MAENEHELVSRQACRSLPSKYREGAELREAAEAIRAVREKADPLAVLVAVLRLTCRGVEGCCCRCCSLCPEFHKALPLL